MQPNVFSRFFGLLLGIFFSLRFSHSRFAVCTFSAFFPRNFQRRTTCFRCNLPPFCAKNAWLGGATDLELFSFPVSITTHSCFFRSALPPKFSEPPILGNRSLCEIICPQSARFLFFCFFGLLLGILFLVPFFSHSRFAVCTFPCVSPGYLSKTHRLFSVQSSAVLCEKRMVGWRDRFGVIFFSRFNY